MNSKHPCRSLVATLLALAISFAQLPARAQEAEAPAEAQPAPPQASQSAPPPAPYPQGYAPPPAYAPPPGYAYPPPPPPRPSKGLMVTGISILGGSYLFSTVLGVALLDDGCAECNDIAPYLFVPVIGPFLAIPQADGARGAFTLLGVVEVVGAGLMIGGIVRFKNSKRRAEQAGYYTFELPKGRSLSLDVSASPLRLGPQLKLRF